MNVAIDTPAVDRFRGVVAQRLGLAFPDEKRALLAEVLGRRAAAWGDCGSYLAHLATAPAPAEIDALAQELTTPETYFFRNIEQYEALAGVVLPQRMRARSVGRQLRFLSLGCASGEEPYTIAMVVREVCDPSWRVSIVGADVNPVVLRKARRAHYSAWSLRAVPEAARRRWFRVDGPDLVLDPLIRESVQFTRCNAAEEDAALWQPDTYDAVYCRNVLMYFTPQAAQAVLDRICGALAPGGFLFVGHAESLRVLSHDLDLRNSHGTFYHQRRQARPTPDQRVAAPDDDWMAAIGAASGRIRRIADRQPPQSEPERAPHTSDEWNVAMELLAREQFGRAIEVVEAFPAHLRGQPDAMLLHAALLTHAGQHTLAAEVCEQVLGGDRLNAGAHYLLAVCCAGNGDPPAAVRHGRVAAYLDPAFAMPRLLLGLQAAQRGDHEAARRDLHRALVLFAHEDADRLLLFGGGFTRDTLSALCRAALAASGDLP
jgi:chemotaxis protein methyltransferase CheR